jgi:hypothetical protein
MARSKDEANERKRVKQHRIGAEVGQIERRDGAAIRY